MRGCLVIESRDSFESRDCERAVAQAAALASVGHEVQLLLVHNGVFVARRGVRSGVLQPALRAGVRVYVEEFSLRERGIPLTQLTPEIAPASLDIVIDHLEQGSMVFWN